MSESIIILTEEPLSAVDAENIMDLYGPDDDVELVLLVPANTKRNLLVDVIDQLTMLDVPGALREFREKPDTETVRAGARDILQASLSVLLAAGAKASGRVADGDAVASLVAQVNDSDARQAVVVTRPHAVADTFRQDWAHQAQRKLGLPVLHLYSGSGFIGDS
ncbi:hypothetical protein QO003_000180 [Arthrobacter silviterrae]|uniref:Uncharacterized protein n=1 Tax=Arthrobacter silviterrae TaxID=2026658 RepID=A0ABX0DFV1_9MICC|nr:MULTISPECIES: hypothetical protein [Arthrobacter]MCU6482366.1 hypothetical protein [Arthrobacter sp. A2-55]MDQ0275877.1 hypothetical protein [Arthrobacter silviterrae]NGN84636.1 hypothetical protein [Arthrobacter silviterrae]